MLILKSVKKIKTALFWPSYDLFSEVWFCDFGRSLVSCSSASSEVILNLSKALPMLFLQSIMMNLVLTKSLGPKRHAVSLTALIFAS